MCTPLRTKLEEGRTLIFNAFNYDKRAHEDWRLKPAYKNLCYVRALEAVDYYYKKELFTSFILGWVSIEMSLYRIWFKFISDKIAQGKDDLLRWNADYIIETLFLSGLETFKDLKNDLDTLKGLRNRLLHGEIVKPTMGNVELCIKTALKLVNILQN